MVATPSPSSPEAIAALSAPEALSWLRGLADTAVHAVHPDSLLPGELPPPPAGPYHQGAAGGWRRQLAGQQAVGMHGVHGGVGQAA